MLILVRTILVILTLSILARAQENPEYQLKSAYIERFTRYISWPDSFGDSVRIGVISSDPDHFRILKRFFSTVPIQKQPVMVSNVLDTASLETFAILFIDSSGDISVEHVVAQVQKLPILTIGNRSEMAQKGVAISFEFHQEKLRFVINTTALTTAGLHASSFLLNTATRVSTDTEGSRE